LYDGTEFLNFRIIGEQHSAEDLSTLKRRCKSCDKHTKSL